MKKLIGLFVVLVMGCRAHWVHTPTPAEPISMQTASVASGLLQPQNFYFTLISQYQESGQARVLVLAEPALKLADLTVSKEQLQVHYQAPKVPSRLIQAWGQLVREQFLVPCPARQMTQKTTVGTFELEVTGGICL